MFNDRLQLPIFEPKDGLDHVRRHRLHLEPAKAGPRVYRLAATDRTRRHA